MEKSALIIVDAQRGFMPDLTDMEQEVRLAQGRRPLSETYTEGYGELPVPEGQQIIRPLNKLIVASERLGHIIATTQDWHPENTAHFSSKPDYQTSWPRHCVGGTPGAKFSHRLDLPANYHRFIKGTEALQPGQPDTSYSGYNAFDPIEDVKLVDFLKVHKVRNVLIGGLALDYCVGQTALDLRQKLGWAVTVFSDATRAVAPETGETMIEKFHENNIVYTDSESWIHDNERLAEDRQRERERKAELKDNWGEYR